MKAVGSTITDREIGLRDLRKYCSRLETLLPTSYLPLDAVTSIPQVDCIGLLVSVFPNPTLREEMFLEARDVFFGAGSLTGASRTRSSVIAAIVAEHLGLPRRSVIGSLVNIPLRSSMKRIRTAASLAYDWVVLGCRRGRLSQISYVHRHVRS